MNASAPLLRYSLYADVEDVCGEPDWVESHFHAASDAEAASKAAAKLAEWRRDFGAGSVRGAQLQQGARRDVPMGVEAR